MNNVYLLIGGNLGNREKNLHNCIALINTTIGQIITTSSIYETAAWGNEKQPNFLNQALFVQTKLSANELLAKTQLVEEKMGRIKTEYWGERNIDIDILFFNDEIIVENDLQIPHKEIANRRFVLVPLYEIALNYLHPILQKNIAKLLEECKDTLTVEKWK